MPLRAGPKLLDHGLLFADIDNRASHAHGFSAGKLHSALTAAPPGSSVGGHDSKFGAIAAGFGDRLVGGGDRRLAILGVDQLIELGAVHADRLALQSAHRRRPRRQRHHVLLQIPLPDAEGGDFLGQLKTVHTLAQLALRGQTLDDVAGQMGARFHHGQFLGVGDGDLGVIHGEGAQSPALGVADGHAPAGAQAESEHEILGRLPAVVRGDIAHDNRLVAEHRAAARPHVRPDPESVDRLHVFRRQTTPRSLAQSDAVLVEQQDGTKASGSGPFNCGGGGVQELLERGPMSDQLQNAAFLFDEARRVFLANALLSEPVQQPIGSQPPQCAQHRGHT
ncbi:MAG TPA: hypothetical protein VIY49_34415 [Bryobacteraceae bacterium]